MGHLPGHLASVGAPSMRLGIYFTFVLCLVSAKLRHFCYRLTVFESLELGCTSVMDFGAFQPSRSVSSSLINDNIRQNC